MKIRTRILTAVLATATAFSCALTASAAPNPTITLDNSKMAATVKEANDGTKTVNATLTLSSKNFEDVTGAKVKLALPDGLTVKEATIVDKSKTWTKDVDYKIDKNTVTLVDVFNIGDAANDLSLNVTLVVSGPNLDMGEVPITVSGDFADTNVDQVYQIANAGSGNLTIGKVEVIKAVGDVNTYVESVATEGYFVPYGGVYVDLGNDKYDYPTKKNDGSFDMLKVTAENVQVFKCKLPDDTRKVTTFGYGKKAGEDDGEFSYDRENSLQFGSYAKKANGVNFGTLVIMGDYNGFKNAVGVTSDDALMQQIVTKYDKNAEKSGAAVTFTKGSNQITVKKVKQNKEMWSNDYYLQYAVRLYKLVAGRTYTTVGYSNNGTDYNFSAEIQSRVNPF